MSQRIVVCAALRHKDYLIVGPRHFDHVMQPFLDMVYKAEQLSDTAQESSKMIKWEQGFIDQNGKFMNRFEALDIAHEAGQINTRRQKSSPTDRLFSEDLY